MTMKAILTDETTRIFSEPKGDSLSIASVHQGEEMDLGKVIRKKKEAWVEITLSNGVVGYIAGSTKIFVIKKVQLLSNTADVYESPSHDAKVVKTFLKKDIFDAVGVEKVDNLDWVKVTDPSGLTGFMRQNVKIKIYNVPSKPAGKKLMITGGIFAGLGIIIFVSSLVQANPLGDSSLLIVGLVVLGGFQFVQGLMQYRQAVKAEEEKLVK
jgi:hypothetical protein